MSDSDVNGFSVTPKRTSFWLALIALATLIYSGISAWNDRGYAIETVQLEQVSSKQVMTRLTDAIDRLDQKIQILNERMARQEGAQK